MKTRFGIALSLFILSSFLLSLDIPSVQAAEPCCAVTANPAMKGRLGRLVIAFPDGAKASGTRVDVYKAGETKSIAGDFGNYSPDLLPGSYDVVISGQRVTGVTITSGHDTKVKVGVLRITADTKTRVELIDPTSGKGLTGDFGSRDFGLPIGPVNVQVAGQSETVTITEGKITDF